MQFFQKQAPQEPRDISEVLAQFAAVKEKCEALSREVETLKEATKNHIDKVAVVRFNPFEGLGGNQSFSLALLDANNNGAVVTSLFSRDSNRVYAKPIENGASTYPLSKEEKEAIEMAQRKNK